VEPTPAPEVSKSQRKKKQAEVTRSKMAQVLEQKSRDFFDRSEHQKPVMNLEISLEIFN
jgi:hypothetical protein